MKKCPACGATVKFGRCSNFDCEYSWWGIGKTEKDFVKKQIKNYAKKDVMQTKFFEALKKKKVGRYLTLIRKFDAAHFLRGYKGACANLHGHTWKVEVKIKFSKTDDIGIAVDFKVLKELIDKNLPDHRNLNDLMVFQTINPTAENLSLWLYTQISRNIYPINLVSVKVWESDTAAAEYAEE